ncbi:MAG: PHP domain-containing protein [Lachnospiraceae bacterium]|nr:PHP domain-containing protein [Lachnospiraceae bacterium]
MNKAVCKIDLHMHTVVSDGTDTPRSIIAKVKEAGIGLFSVTDHDAVKCGNIIPMLLEEDDPFFIPGVEFSCRDEEGKYHILGYDFDPVASSVIRVVTLGHSFRIKKVKARLDFLKDEFGFTFPEDELAALMTMDNPGKPHIGNMMVKYGYAETKEQAIKQYIDKIRFKNEYVRPETAISGILAGGGIPVLAHPSYGSGDELIIGEDMEKRLKKLMAFGLRGVEAFYSGFTKKLQEEVLGLAEKYNLYVTAGSDYHGSNKMVVLGDTGFGSDTVMPQGMQRFLERIGYTA